MRCLGSVAARSSCGRSSVEQVLHADPEPSGLVRVAVADAAPLVPIRSLPSFASPLGRAPVVRHDHVGVGRHVEAVDADPPAPQPVDLLDSTIGSTTTPQPMAHFLPGHRTPDGTSWNLNVSPSRTIV